MRQSPRDTPQSSLGVGLFSLFSQFAPPPVSQIAREDYNERLQRALSQSSWSSTASTSTSQQSHEIVQLRAQWSRLTAENSRLTVENQQLRDRLAKILEQDPQWIAMSGEREEQQDDGDDLFINPLYFLTRL